MFFDKLVIALVSPLGTALLLWAAALCLYGRTRRQALARFLGLLGLLWLLLWSLPPVSHALRAQLEGGYPAVALSEVPQADVLVLLGGCIRPPELAGQTPDMGSAADRVWLAARLHKAGKAPLLVLSGGSDKAVSATSEAQAMRELLLDMGVPDAALLLEEDSRNTRENAAFVARLLTNRHPGIASSPRPKVLLVTSALHMARARALLEAQGLDVEPVPTDHEARVRFSAVDWLPDADALDGSARAIKALVGQWTGR